MASQATALTVQSLLVYDTRSGRIVHIHHYGAPVGTTLPSDAEISGFAVAEAARLTNRDATTLATLSFDRQALRPGVAYFVHPVAKSLIEGDSSGHAPFVGVG